MKFSSYLLFSLFLIFACLWSAEANTSAPNDSIQAWDNSVVDVRTPSADTIAYYKQLSEYQYEPLNQEPSLWDRFWAWVRSMLFSGDADYSWVSWLILVVAVLALLAIVLKLIGIPIKGLFVFSRSTKVTDLAFASGTMDLEQENLEKLFKKYHSLEAYREATRILFLLALRQLNRQSIIKWNSWKTDREYYYEITNTELKQNFLNVMRHYEYIWFGKFEPSSEQYKKVKNQFDELMIQIKAD
ncbi:DUF4129 domain-containing protein [Carboxylicivirga sp. N1Y90]|uniref:DUF4129 domain-containing protein n=1 Tax=Carboxylicivirga fragile TaxID=3417571 RepID=UPI003D33D2EE|nr:hypothetical protein [Marinilabiliaceae bacterium N1Y90]